MRLPVDMTISDFRLVKSPGLREPTNYYAALRLKATMQTVSDEVMWLTIKP
jgi:hypothetical protein